VTKAAGASAELSCSAGGKTSLRSWDTSGACPTVAADVLWLSTSPPLLSFAITTDCGEGGPQVSEHVLRGCELADVDTDDASGTDTRAWADGLWGMRVGGGS